MLIALMALMSSPSTQRLPKIVEEIEEVFEYKDIIRDWQGRVTFDLGNDVHRLVPKGRILSITKNTIVLGSLKIV